MDVSKDKPKLHSWGMLMFIACGVSFGCYFGSNMRLPVVPLYAKSLGIDTAHIGFINSAFFLMAGFLSFPFGLVSDRVGRKLLACLGLLVLTAASFMLYFSDTFVLMTLSYVFIGIGLAAFGPTMMSFVADISPLTHLGRSYGWYTTALYCGMSLGPAAGGFIAHAAGFLPVFLVSGVLVLVNFFLVVFFLPKEQSFLVPRMDKPKTAAVLARLFKNRPLMGCWLLTLAGCFGLGMFMTFLPLHAENQGLLVSHIGLVFLAQGLVNGFSRIPLGYLSDKVRDRKILVVIGMIGFAAAMSGFGISRTMGHFMTFAVVMGLSMGLAFTSIGALIAETVDAESRGVAMGGYNSCIYFGMMLSSFLMGSVIEMVGFDYSFHLTATINLLLIGVFYLFMKGYSPSK
ncbi:MAG: MFS transporter [Pseudomonadota bacterium]